MGLDAKIGSLAPGKRADLIMVDTRHLNLAVRTDPARLLVEAARSPKVKFPVSSFPYQVSGFRFHAALAGSVAPDSVP